MSTPVLRPYQLECHDNVFSSWDSGLDRVAISAATGAGKSVILAAIARSFIRLYGGPVVLLAHRRELITQAAKHFKKAGPDLRVEVVIGSPGPKNSTTRARKLNAWKHADVICTSPQTLASATTLRVFPLPRLIIVDEAHRSPANQYRKVLTALGAFSGTKTLGVTATPFREDSKSFSDIFQAVVANIDIGWLITHCDDGNGGVIDCEPGNGYLVPPVLHHLLVDGLDLSVVPMSRMNGTVDFKEAELAAAMEAAGAFDMVIDIILKKYSHLKGAIFAPSVNSSRYMAERMTERGLGCHHIDGTTPPKQRDDLTEELRSNKVRWVSNVGIFVEGFDMPDIDMVVLASPTRSRIKFRQSVGRALRPFPGKREAIVLDVAGASDGMSLAGVEALTDTEVLTAGDGETLTDLLARTDRERRGQYNRIQAHASKAQDIQNRAEKTLEQVRLTAEGSRDKLPGLDAFVETATPRHHTVLDHTTAALDRFLQTTPAMTMKELADAEDFISERTGLASKALSEVDSVKAVMRHALMQLKDDPASEVSQAIITGELKTVKGNLFDEEEERYKPGAPGDVQGLKLRKTSKERKPVHDARYGWCMQSSNGHLFVPVHGINQETGLNQKDPVALVVAVKTGDVYTPVIWDATTQKVDGIATTMNLDDCYQLVVERALEDTVASNLLNPNAAWRKKPSSDKATAFAKRIAPNVEIPDNATAGFTGDVVMYSKYNKIVNALGVHVVKQLALRTPELVR